MSDGEPWKLLAQQLENTDIAARAVWFRPNAHHRSIVETMPGASERTPLIGNGNGNGNGAVARGPKAAVGNRPPPLKYELSTPRFVAIL